MWNKKGQSNEMWGPDTFLFWIVFGVAMGFAAAYFIVLVDSQQSKRSVIPEGVETTTLVERFTNSPHCFALANQENNFVNPGVIDMTKFTQPRLNVCMEHIGNTDPSFKLRLRSRTTSVDEVIQTTNWNPNRPVERRIPKTVQIAKDGKTFNGELTIEVQNFK